MQVSKFPQDLKAHQELRELMMQQILLFGLWKISAGMCIIAMDLSFILVRRRSLRADIPVRFRVGKEHSS